MTSRTVALLAGGLAAIYVSVRLALLWRFPPHVDEVTFASYVLRGLDNPEARFIALTAGQQPLLPWAGIGIATLGVEPLTSLRLVSFLAGAGTAVAAGWLGYRLGGRQTALASAGFWVLLPLGVVYSVMGLYDPLAAFLIVSALVLQVMLAERPRLDVALLLGVALGLGLLTKLTSIASIALLPASLMLFDWGPTGRARRLGRWLGAVLVALVVAWLLYRLMYLSQFSDDVDEGRAALAYHSLADFLAEPRRWLEANWPSYQAALIGYLTVPGVACVLTGVAKGLRSPGVRALTGLLLLWGVVPIAGAVALADVPFVRWIVIAGPPLVVLGGLGLVTVTCFVVRLASRDQPRLVAPVGIGVVALLLLPAIIWEAHTVAQPAVRPYPGHDDIDYVREWSAGGPWLDLVPEIERRVGSGRALVATAGPGVGYLALALRDNPRVGFVDAETSNDPGALYGLENGRPLPSGPDDLAWRLVRGYDRPRRGIPVTLWQRGVLVDLVFAATPDELRAVIGGSDNDFDAFVEARPAVAAWLNAWYEAQDE